LYFIGAPDRDFQPIPPFVIWSTKSFLSHSITSGRIIRKSAGRKADQTSPVSSSLLLISMCWSHTFLAVKYSSRSRINKTRMFLAVFSWKDDFGNTWKGLTRVSNNINVMNSNIINNDMFINWTLWYRGYNINITSVFELNLLTSVYIIYQLIIFLYVF